MGRAFHRNPLEVFHFQQPEDTFILLAAFERFEFSLELLGS